MCLIAMAKAPRTIVNNNKIIALLCFPINYDVAVGLREIAYAEKAYFLSWFAKILLVENFNFLIFFKWFL